MSEFKFDFAREGDDKLLVKTPVLVCQNVWAGFVFETFPRFQNPSELMLSCHHSGRYLNRRTDNVDEIAGGQAGTYYRHAYLPHGERSNERQSANGLIHVPETRTFYLEQIQADLEENPRSRTALLNGLRQVHAETVKYLLNELINVPKRTEYKNVKTKKELRDNLANNFSRSGLLTGSYSGHNEPWFILAKEIPLGKLPLYMSGERDVLRSQTALDFLRDLDLMLREDGELAPMNLLQVSAVMIQRYSDIVKV